jgi:hypothetical protein
MIKSRNLIITHGFTIAILLRITTYRQVLSQLLLSLRKLPSPAELHPKQRYDAVDNQEAEWALFCVSQQGRYRFYNLCVAKEGQL